MTKRGYTLAGAMLALLVCSVLFAWAISPLYASGEFNPIQKPGDHHHIEGGVQYGSRVGVDCTPVGCVSGSTMWYSYRDTSGNAVYTSRACDKAPDGDWVGTQITKRNGATARAIDRDGLGGNCGFVSVHVGREPKGHRGFILNNGRYGDNKPDVFGRFSCHIRRC